MEKFINIVLPAIPQTLTMVLVSSLIGVVVGIPLAVVLYITKRGGLYENLSIYRFLDTLINVLRSLPFIVLMLILVPLTVFIVGRRIGLQAAIVPLSVSAIPFLARLVEGDLNEIDKGIIEAARSMGTSAIEVVSRVVLKEATPKIISSITMTIIALVGQSAIVGTIGGGGLGDVALRYGYQRNELDILWMSCIAIILIVQIVQFIGKTLSKKLDKK